jgi:hypothetical protein
VGTGVETAVATVIGANVGVGVGTLEGVAVGTALGVAVGVGLAMIVGASRDVTLAGATATSMVCQAAELFPEAVEVPVEPGDSWALWPAAHPSPPIEKSVVRSLDRTKLTA